MVMTSFSAHHDAVHICVPSHKHSNHACQRLSASESRDGMIGSTFVPRELNSCPVQSCADLSTSTASGSCNGITSNPNNDSLVSVYQLKCVFVCPGEIQCDSGSVQQHRRPQAANAIQSSKWHGHLECLTTEMSSFLLHNETAHHHEHPVALARPTSTSSNW